MWLMYIINLLLIIQEIFFYILILEKGKETIMVVWNKVDSNVEV